MVEPIDIAAAIRRLRRPRSQREVAKKAGIPPDYWSRLESGKVRPRKVTCTKIAKGLGVKEEHFWDVVNDVWKKRRHTQSDERPPEALAEPADFGPTSPLFQLEEHLAAINRHVREVAHLLFKAASAR